MKKDILSQLKALWIENFQDTDTYTDLIFDNYANPDTLLYIEKDGKVVSSLLGIPYNFSGDVQLKGLYLCGLSTQEEYRGKGYMSELINRINSKARELGYDFTFLIPANDGLRRYYADRGYVDAFYCFNEHYAPGHKFLKQWPENVTVVKMWDYLNTEGEISYRKMKEDAVEFLLKIQNKNSENENCKNEKRSKFADLVHSSFDWNAVLEESIISKTDVFIALVNNNIYGVLFCESNAEGILVKEIFYANPEVKNCLLQGVENAYKMVPLTYRRKLEKYDIYGNSEKQLWEPFYPQNNPVSSEYEDISVIETPFNHLRLANPYGMCKILDIDNLLLKLDCKKNKDNIADNIKDSTDLLWNTEKLNMEEIEHIIFRKPAAQTGEDADLFGLPVLNLSISLLLE